MANQEGKQTHSPFLNPKPHKESHFTAGEMVRDVIMGVSDGLTVPFALAAGLSGASATSSLVLVAGLAEVAAGAVSMGLGGRIAYCGFSLKKNEHFYSEENRKKKTPRLPSGCPGKKQKNRTQQCFLYYMYTRNRYLAAKSEADHYMREMEREQEEIINVPDTEASEIGEILSQYGLEPDEYRPVVNALRRNPQAWLEFMMKFELGLEKPDPKRAVQSAITIALSYIIGGLFPLSPYFFIPIAQEAMFISIVVTVIALIFFGYIKGKFTGSRPILSAVQTALIGVLASGVAYGMAKAVQFV